MSAKGTPGRNQHTVAARDSGRLAHPSRHTAFRELEDVVAREEILASLAAGADPRCATLLAFLGDISLGSQSLPTLARRAGLAYADVLRLITAYRLDRGLLAMSAHVPKVLEDAAIDATAKMIPCRACQGSGKLRGEGVIDEATGETASGVPVACWNCEGVGKVRKAGDADARELVFETLGLTGKGKGINIGINVAAGGVASVEEDMASAQRVIDAVPPSAGESAGVSAVADAPPAPSPEAQS